MSELREQYEREHPGKSVFVPGIGRVPSLDYVAWLERRAACAEQLAAACSHAHQYVLANAEDACDYRLAEELNAALAAHEAACKEKP